MGKVLRPAKRGKIPICVVRAAIKKAHDADRESRTFRIYYVGSPRVALDKALTKIAEEQAYDFLGSGYNFKTNIRDLAFEKPQAWEKLDKTA